MDFLAQKSSKIQTDVTENTIRDFILQNGMVDVKVCAIDETWSGLKLVFRLKTVNTETKSLYMIK